MNKHLIVGLAFLFIITSLSPLILGYKQISTVEQEEINATLANLRYLCTTPEGFDQDRYEHYKYICLRSLEAQDDIDDVDVYEPVTTEPEEADPEYGLPLPITLGLMNSSWPMKSHDIHHTGRSPYSTEEINNLEKWRFYVENWIIGAPVLDDDCVIYFGTSGWDLYAIYPNCTLKWNFHINGKIWSAPAIAEDGTVYVTSYDCGLYAINPDGSQKWRFGSGGGVSSSPAISADGIIYYGVMGPDYDGRIYAINPDGTEKWHYDTGYWIESDPVIGDDGTVYIGSGDTYFYAMNPNGTLKWRFKTGDEIHGHASIADDGTIYISSFDDYLYAINPDGTEKWKSDVDFGLSNGVAIGDDGTIYVARLKMHALDPVDGSVIWSTELGGEHWIGESSPCVSADGTIYIGTHDGIPTSNGGDIIAFNPDGSIKWRKGISDANWVDSSPCIGPDGTVYIGSAYYQGFLHAFGPVDSNEPPNAPTISGETHGNVGESYWYTISAVDPDNNPIQFYIDWGDGEEGWYREWASGAPTYAENSWDEEGDYTIRIKVKDTLGEESDWAYLEVTMPVDQQTSVYNFPIIQRILELFPNAFPIIRQLIGL